MSIYTNLGSIRIYTVMEKHIGSAVTEILSNTDPVTFIYELQKNMYTVLLLWLLYDFFLSFSEYLNIQSFYC